MVNLAIETKTSFNVGVNGDWLPSGASSGHSVNCSFWHFRMGFIYSLGGCRLFVTFEIVKTLSCWCFPLMPFKAYINICAIAINTISRCYCFHRPVMSGNSCTLQNGIQTKRSSSSRVALNLWGQQLCCRKKKSSSIRFCLDFNLWSNVLRPARPQLIFLTFSDGLCDGTVTSLWGRRLKLLFFFLDDTFHMCACEKADRLVHALCVTANFLRPFAWCVWCAP